MEWISDKENPKQSGWVIASTNYGVGFAYYDVSAKGYTKVEFTTRDTSAKTKILHWLPLPPVPEGDFDPDAGGPQRQVF